MERLIKDSKVIPASKLAEAKEQALQRVRDFEAASEDQQRHNRTATPTPRDKLEQLPLNSERFEE